MRVSLCRHAGRITGYPLAVAKLKVQDKMVFRFSAPFPAVPVGECARDAAVLSTIRRNANPAAATQP